MDCPKPPGKQSRLPPDQPADHRTCPGSPRPPGCLRSTPAYRGSQFPLELGSSPPQPAQHELVGVTGAPHQPLQEPPGSRVLADRQSGLPLSDPDSEYLEIPRLPREGHEPAQFPAGSPGNFGKPGLEIADQAPEPPDRGPVVVESFGVVRLSQAGRLVDPAVHLGQRNPAGRLGDREVHERRGSTGRPWGAHRRPKLTASDLHG